MRLQRVGHNSATEQQQAPSLALKTRESEDSQSDCVATIAYEMPIRVEVLQRLSRRWIRSLQGFTILLKNQQTHSHHILWYPLVLISVARTESILGWLSRKRYLGTDTKRLMEFPEIWTWSFHSQEEHICTLPSRLLQQRPWVATFEHKPRSPCGDPRGGPRGPLSYSLWNHGTTLLYSITLSGNDMLLLF